MDLGPWTAPAGHSVDAFRRRARERLSLDRPVATPAMPSRAHDAKDLRFYDTWIPHPGMGLTPAALTNAQRQAELGYPQLQCDMLADLVRGDAHARNLFEHRERVVAHKELVIGAGDPSDEAQASSRALAFALARLPVKAAVEHLLRGTHRDGYAGVEIDWDLLEFEGRPWIVPVWLSLVPNRRFRVGVEGMAPVPTYPDGSPTGETTVRYDDLRLFQDLKVPQGHPLRPGKWIVFKRQPSQIASGGLGVTAALYMLAKRYSWRDWIVLCERFGLPWPIVKYDREQNDDATLEVAQQIVRELGSDGGAAVGKGLEIEVVKGVESSPIQDRHIAYCNAELSKLVNGSTLRNDNSGSGGSSGGSYALGSVHDSVAWDEVRADGSMVNERLGECVASPFAIYNNLAKPAPVFELMVEPDLGPVEFVSLGVKLKNELGMGVSQKQVRARTGVRAPLNDDDDAPGMQVDKLGTAAGGPP